MSEDTLQEQLYYAIELLLWILEHKGEDAPEKIMVASMVYALCVVQSERGRTCQRK